jgi:hypothetical protein
MKDIAILLVHLLTTVAKFLGRGGTKAIIAENLLLKQQLLVLTRSRRRAPNLSNADRFLMGFWSLFLRPGRIAKVAVSIQPSTLFKFHQYLVRRKYRRLFSPKKRTKPGPKGPSEPLIRAIVELKRRNRRFGCPRIASIISKTFGVEIDKNTVQRVLSKHYRPESSGNGPSWLTFLGHLKDSLWSLDPPMRIYTPEKPLRAGTDGSVHPSDHRLRCSGWRCRWHRALPYVQPNQFRKGTTRGAKILMRPSEGNIAAAHLPTDQFFSAKRLGKI